MSDFTEAEIEAIAEAATLGPHSGLERLTELFGSSPVRLARAAAVADGLVGLVRAAKRRTGEAAAHRSGDQVPVRDVGLSGRVLRAKR